MKKQELIYNDYLAVAELLHKKQLMRGLDKLKPWIDELCDWESQHELETLANTFGMMLNYFRQSLDDPQRDELLCALVRRACQLNRRVYLARYERDNNNLYFTHYRKQLSNPKTPADYEEALQHYAQEWSVAELTHEGERLVEYRKKLRAEHDTLCNEMFERMWATPFWNKLWEDSATDFLNAPLVPLNDKALMVSAVTLGALEVFDEHKVLFLLSAALHEKPLINQRGIVGLMLVMTKYDHDFLCDDNLMHLITEALNCDTVAGVDLCVAMELYMRTEEAGEVERKVKEELIPELKKQQKQMDSDDDDIDDEKLFEGVNLEWLENNPRLQQQIQEINEMQMNGGDIYLHTFGQLKGYTFFHEIGNWFYPFDAEHSALQSESTAKLLAPGSVLIAMMNGSLFCDSDKYSFALTVSRMPQFSVDKIAEQLPTDQMADFEEVLKKQEWANVHHRLICQQYIHSLNRFYKLFARRHEFDDPFKNVDGVFGKQWWRRMLFFKITNENQAIADYCMQRKKYEVAKELYWMLCTCAGVTAELCQKWGFCAEQSGNIHDALIAYDEAEILKPDNLWTMRHVAMCLEAEKRYEASAQYYEKILEVEPENLSALFSLAHCYAEMNQSECVMRLLYKLVYLRPNSRKALAAIARAALEYGKLDVATKYAGRLVERSNLGANDYVLVGHIAFCNHNNDEALQHYLSAKALGVQPGLNDLVNAGVDFLKEYGLSTIDVMLMEELIRRG